jgi:ABC-type oligopeptide transport system substrate-binding subunit
METQDLDLLKTSFEVALGKWIGELKRQQMLLAESTHSTRSEDAWKNADFDQEVAQKATQRAKKEYEDALRELNFGF